MASRQTRRGARRQAIVGSADEGDRRRERARMLRELRRREGAIAPDRYAPWHPAESFMLAGRRRLAAAMLHRAGAFPKSETPCLEVGYGRRGWLGDLVSWGVRETRITGIELDAARASEARRLLPSADLRVGDGCDLPWASARFGLAIASTVFTSVLDDGIRFRLAEEIQRVLIPGGALLWYDFRVNPLNPHARGIGRRALQALFPALAGDVRSATLAPPLTRLVAPRSHWLATTLEALPPLRTHLLAVLTKRQATS